MRKGHQCAVPVYTLTMKTLSILHFAHTTRRRDPQERRGKNEIKMSKRTCENLHHMHIFHTDGQTDGQKGEEHFPLTVVMSVMFA